MKEKGRCQQLEKENKELHNEIHSQKKEKFRMTRDFKHKVDKKTGILTKILKYRNLKNEFG